MVPSSGSLIGAGLSGLPVCNRNPDSALTLLFPVDKSRKRTTSPQAILCSNADLLAAVLDSNDGLCRAKRRARGLVIPLATKAQAPHCVLAHFRERRPASRCQRPIRYCGTRRHHRRGPTRRGRVLGKSRRVFCSSIDEAHATAIQVRIAKLVLSVIFALLVVDHAIGLGWAVASGDGYTTPSTLHLITSVYLLTLCVSNLSANTISTSWPTVIHLSALTVVSSLLQATSLLLPSEHPSITSPEDESNGTVFWFISWVLTTVATVLAWTIPRGPTRYFPPERVFTLKSLATASPSARENVSEAVSTSVWGKNQTTSLDIRTLSNVSPDRVYLLPVHHGSRHARLHRRKSGNPRPANPPGQSPGDGYLH
jgi:hypothetical protein